MTLLMKDPDAVLDYAIDWSAEYLGDDAIADSRWSVEPDEAGGLAIITSRFSEGTAVVQAGGGMPGRLYRLVNQVTLESGEIDSRSIVLRVERR